MSATLNSLLKRQNYGSGTMDSTPSTTSTNNPYDTDDDGYYSDTSYVLRYVILGVIILFIFIWVVGGIWHANRRLRRGQQPLWYHRWLVPSRRRNPGAYAQQWPHNGPPNYDPATGTYYPPPNGQAYPMHTLQHSEYAPPPPVYSNDAPPGYAPPPGPPPGREPKGADAATSTVTPVAGESTLQAAAGAPSQPAPAAHPSHPTS